MPIIRKEEAPLKKLKLWEENPRGIKKEDFERLKNQIKTLGVYVPLVVNEDYVVLSGNMRLRAFQDLKVDPVWVTVVDAKDKETMIKYALSANDRAGYYEEDQLAELILSVPDLKLDDYKVDLGQLTTIPDLLSKFAPDEIVEDEAPEVSDEEPVSKLGEVYQLGRHRLMCGDSTKIEDVEKLMDGKKADMVFTDPPYGMNLDTDYSSLNSNPKFVEEKHLKSMQGNKYSKVIGDDADYDPNHLFTMFSDTKELFLWGADYYAERLPNKNDGSWIVWDKRNENEQLDKMFGSQFELCWSKSRHKREIARIQWAGVFGTEKEFDHKRHHPTQKPIALSSWFIEKYSKSEQLIVDLFLGSGSTLIACEQTNRTCYGMELYEVYCDTIRRRYWKFVNKGNEDGWQEGTPIISSI